MKILIHLNIALKTLLKIKKSLYFILFSIAIGIASIYMIVYFSQVVRHEMARRFHSQGQDLFTIIQHSQTGKVGPNQIRPFNSEAIEFLKHDPYFIYDVAPEISSKGKIRFDHTEVSVNTIGVLEGYKNVHGLTLKFGRFFNKYDSNKECCIIGHNLYERIRESASDSLLGQKVHLGPQLVEIIGVLQPSSSIGQEYSIDEAVLIPLDRMAEFLTNPVITKATIRANPNRSVTDVISYLEHGLQNYIGDITLYEITNQQIFLQDMSELLKVLSIVLGIIGSVALVLGAWSLLRLMGLSTLTLRNEITFIQILGAKKNRITRQLVLEALILALGGGIIGALLGIVSSYFAAQIGGWVLMISSPALILSTFICICIGFVAGLYPIMGNPFLKN